MFTIRVSYLTDDGVFRTTVKAVDNNRCVVECDCWALVEVMLFAEYFDTKSLDYIVHFIVFLVDHYQAAAVTCTASVGTIYELLFFVEHETAR